MKISVKQFWVRIVVVAFVFVSLFLFARVSVLLKQSPNDSVRYGITFSPVYTTYLGLDVMKTYQDLVENVGVRVVRLPVYWSDIEPQQNQYIWNQLDELIKYSEAHQVKLTLALGHKVPRWPECFIPNWAQKFSESDQQKAVMKMIETVVRRYQGSPAIERWQIENEPFLPFGVCQQMKEENLEEEIAFVHTLDNRPVQITASGEMEPWGLSAGLSDVFGISVYRMTWNNVFGYFTYPLSPFYYQMRQWLILGKGASFIVSELQAEPWFSEDYKNQPASYWYDKFDAQNFEDNIRFVNEMRVKEAYLWGAEWWVYMKQHDEDRLWNKAKELFSSQK